MKNAFSRAGRTCASILIGGVLIAGALLAGAEDRVIVTLPHAVTVGTMILPAGQYTISNVDLVGNEEYFTIRSASTPTLTLQAQKIENSEPGKTSVIFRKEGDVWHLDKMFVSGEGTGYQFMNIRVKYGMAWNGSGTKPEGHSGDVLAP